MRYDHESRGEAKIEGAILLALKMEKATSRWLLGSQKPKLGFTELKLWCQQA